MVLAVDEARLLSVSEPPEAGFLTNLRFDLLSPFGFILAVQPGLRATPRQHKFEAVWQRAYAVG